MNTYSRHRQPGIASQGARTQLPRDSAEYPLLPGAFDPWLLPERQRLKVCHQVVVSGGPQLFDMQPAGLLETEPLLQEEARPRHDVRDARSDRFILHTVGLSALVPAAHALAFRVRGARVVGTVGQRRVERHAIKMILVPWAAGDRQPGGAHVRRQEGEARSEERRVGKVRASPRPTVL